MPAVRLPVFVGGEGLPLPVKVTTCVDPDAVRQHLETMEKRVVKDVKVVG